MRGAIREDDIPDFLGGENPQDDPDGSTTRVLRHFYDPVNRAPLTVAGLPLGADAPTWATGAEDAFGCANCEDPNRRNHFTIRDARIAEWRALTGQDRSGDTAIGPNGRPSDDAVRKAYWATLFRSLGDVLHLVQDMAQPQHTRNETHAKANGVSKTIYEAYTEARATGGKFTCAGGTPAPSLPPLDYGGYPIPEFSRYSEYFSTVPTDTNGAVATGRGMADYSNRGFFTAGSNINNTKYVLPDPSPSAYSASQVTLASPCIPAGLSSELLIGSVSDTVTGEFNVAPLAARGLWNVPGFPGVLQAVDYSLSEDVYRAMGDLLVPRAVAYSAGLLNYFFRGRLDIQIENYNRSDVTLKFKNLNETDTVYSDNGDSQLIVAYRYLDAGRKEVFGTSGIVPMKAADDVAPLAVSQSYTFTFPSALPAGADELEFRLVFLGTLGNEADAVALGYKPMTSPGFLVRPSELPADGISGLRHIYKKKDGVWKLSSESGFVVGNVDWKGKDPDDVLSFDGPQSRYFFNTDRSGYSQSIYRKGRLWAQVPDSLVLGVGIRTFNDKRYLTVISYAPFSGLLSVYSREFAETYPNEDPYDVNTNPLGWKLLASFDTGSLGSAVTPFFMNASGTEAQGLMGKDGVFVYRFGTRIKLNIDGEAVTRTDFDNSGSYLSTTEKSINFAPSIVVGPGIIQGGEGLSCPIISGECLAYCGPNGDICSQRVSDTSVSTVQRETTTFSYSTGQPKIIAVDYAGDTEVFATLEYAGVPVSEQIDTTYNMSDRQVSQANSDCLSGTFTRNLSETINKVLRNSRSGGLRINVAGVMVPAQWQTSTSSYTATDTGSFSRSTGIPNEQQRSFTYSSSSSSENATGKLVYLDLRYKNVVYSELEFSANSALHETGTLSGNGVGSLEDISGGGTSNPRVYSLLSNVNGNLLPLHRWRGQSSAYSLTGIFRATINSYCHDPFNENSETPSPNLTFGAGQAWGHIHEAAVKGLDTQTLQGYARDVNGNLFASQTLWEEQSPPPPGQAGPQAVGKWNYLTDGDPVTLFGLTGSNPYFTRVGLY